MIRERQHRLFVRYFTWFWLAYAYVYLNGQILSEPWTNWNVVSMASLLVLLLANIWQFSSLEALVARFLLPLLRRFWR